MEKPTQFACAEELSPLRISRPPPAYERKKRRKTYRVSAMPSSCAFPRAARPATTVYGPDDPSETVIYRVVEDRCRARSPRGVIDKSAKPVFGDAILLDLARRGIRSIEFIGVRYAIAAGPFGDGTEGGAGSDFALFTWSGGAVHVPERVEGVAFSKLRPEALFAIPGTDEVAVLSDDGEEKIEGFACKDKELPGEKKSFRGITLMLPMVLAATPTSASGSYYTVSKQHRTRRRPITNARVFSQNDEYTKTAWLPAFFYSRKRKDIYANHGQLG